MKYYSPIIEATELFELHGMEDLVVVDASNEANARSLYEAEHLDGALFVDTNTQLANPTSSPASGGRHPLPTLVQFKETLEGIGINPQSRVIIYDRKNGSNAAARFWWMLRSFGHQEVQVINGGYPAAAKINFPRNSNRVTAKRSSYPTPDNWIYPLSSINEISNASLDGRYTIVDVRDHDRFTGKSETMDPVAGHIPNAINIPFTSNLDEHGLFMKPQGLRQKYEFLFKKSRPEDIIVHCGSGITACHTVLAMDYAGLPIPKLYVGSWSEWVRNGKPVAKGGY